MAVGSSAVSYPLGGHGQTSVSCSLFRMFRDNLVPKHEIGLDVFFASRLLRLALLAPNIVEAILMGNEPDGLSLTKLTRQMSVDWEE